MSIQQQFQHLLLQIFGTEDPLEPRLQYNAHEIPQWLVSQHIHSGYRFHVNFLDCVRSIFYLHNETISIWTHLLPSLIFAVMAVDFTVNRRREYDSIVFGKLCVAFATVFGASAFMHTFNPINEDWFYHTLGMDWGAIAFAVMGGGSTLATLGFHNNPKRQALWQVGFMIPCTLFASVASSSSFHTMPPAVKISLVLILWAAVIAFGIDLTYSLKPNELARVKQVVYGPTVLCFVGCVVFGAEFPEAQLTDVDFSISRGHHLFHHVWSVVFAFWFLRNNVEWAKELHAKGNKQHQC